MNFILFIQHIRAFHRKIKSIVSVCRKRFKVFFRLYFRCWSIVETTRSYLAVSGPLTATATWSSRMWGKCGLRYLNLSLLLSYNHNYAPLSCLNWLMFFAYCRYPRLGRVRRKHSLLTRTGSSARCSCEGIQSSSFSGIPSEVRDLKSEYGHSFQLATWLGLIGC